MNKMERACLDHAAAWLRYSRSPEARRDLDRDKAARAALDRTHGHLPACGLLQCAPDCPSRRRKK